MSTAGTMPPPDAAWIRGVGEHREALAAYLDAAGAIRESGWSRPVADGKWSPAQITEHLTLAYQAIQQELAGGPPMALRVTGWRQTAFRQFLLPHILFHRRIPIRARSPRELRPAETDSLAPRDAALERLRVLGTSTEQEVQRAGDNPDRCITHPYFGAIPLLRALRLCAVHVDHHRRQLDGC
ncbi:MAG TPA: DinB family protein [Longimicrobiaceae bacterium]|nr:DinB family protein [Longimicrobiaceae bacterium]